MKFITLPFLSYLKYFLDLLNSLESSIRSTLEIGGSCLNFLGLSISLLPFLASISSSSYLSFSSSWPSSLTSPSPPDPTSLSPSSSPEFFFYHFFINRKPSYPACSFMVINFIVFLINSPPSTQWFIASSLPFFLPLPSNLSAGTTLI